MSHDDVVVHVLIPKTECCVWVHYRVNHFLNVENNCRCTHPILMAISSWETEEVKFNFNCGACHFTLLVNCKSVIVKIVIVKVTLNSQEYGKG